MWIKAMDWPFKFQTPGLTKRSLPCFAASKCKRKTIVYTLGKTVPQEQLKGAQCSEPVKSFPALQYPSHPLSS